MDARGDGSAWSRYLPRTPVLAESGLCCRGAGVQGSRPAMVPRRLSTHALVFLSSGRGRYVGAPYAGAVEVVAPAVIWLFPGVEHAYDPSPAGWVEQWVLFEGTAVRGYESAGAWRRDQPVRPAGPQLAGDVAPVFATLRDCTRFPGRRAELLAATLIHTLVGLAAASTPPSGSDVSVRESVAEAVVATACAPASVAERARALGLTAEQLRAEVSAATSLSVHELVLRTRVARACDLLAATDLSVAAVSHQVGYDDPAYFSRLFRERVGSSPTTFRSQAVG
ncbi:helix-turn-helix domain-containing protein [uncultured Friedmanniella sp.]|uniref:helix-turn-helix domain-containing protein n=1 Tax=uncultured Friedmanniella sp. TaxID=335381 RepID=UPI0035CA8A09